MSGSLFVKSEKWYTVPQKFVRKILCDSSGLQIIFNENIIPDIPNVKIKDKIYYLHIEHPESDFDLNGCDVIFETDQKDVASIGTLFKLNSTTGFAGIIFNGDSSSEENNYLDQDKIKEYDDVISKSQDFNSNYSIKDGLPIIPRKNHKHKKFHGDKLFSPIQGHVSIIKPSRAFVPLHKMPHKHGKH